MAGKQSLLVQAAVALLAHTVAADHHEEHDYTSSTMMAEATPAPTTTLVCGRDGATPKSNDITGVSYVIGYYGNGVPLEAPAADEAVILWSYPIDQCTALAPQNGLYGKFTCVNDDTVKLEKFADDDPQCEAAADSSVEYDLTETEDLGAGLTWDCTGEVGVGYVAIDFSVGGGCQANQHTYGVVNVCGPNRIPADFVHSGFSELYCDADGAKVEAYTLSADQCSSADNYCSDLTITNACALVFETAAEIFGKVVECNADATEEDDGSAHAPFASAALFAAALFAALM